MSERSMANRRFVNVTDWDIKEGTPNCNGRCPIALAAMRAFPEAVAVDVSKKDIMIYLDDDWDNKQFWSLSEEAQEFVENFDALRETKPIMFFSDLQPSYDPTK